MNIGLGLGLGATPHRVSGTATQHVGGLRQAASGAETFSGTATQYVGGLRQAGASVTMNQWLRADLGVTSSAGFVSAWADQSGHGNDVAQAGSNKPTLNTSDALYNNQATISFSNALSQYLKSTAYVLAQPLTIIVVGENDGTSVNLAGFVDSTGGALALYSTLTNGYAGMSSSAAVNSTTAVTSKSVIAAVYSGASSKLYVNSSASAVASGSAGTNGISTYTVGGAGVNANPLTGKIAELRVFKGAMSSAAIGAVFSELSTRYSGSWS